MKSAFRSAASVTVFSFASQMVLVVCQLVAAARFGASSDMDAFVSAGTLPQFVISVLLASLSFVFIPFFVEQQSKGDAAKAQQLSVGLFNITMLALGVITVAGIFFSREILLVITPGLDEPTLDIGVRISMVTWPTVLATGATMLLASLHQARQEFIWQAAVPMIGAVINLVLLVLLAPSLGIMGLALATTAGVVVQVLLLSRGLFREGYQLRLYWKDAGLQQVLRVAAPLVFVAAVTKFTPLMDRFLASELGSGAISHLNYAFKIVTLVSVLISTGISTVIFPRMAADFAGDNPGALGNTISLGLRIMWLICAPVVTIGMVLSLPVVLLLFNRGEFTLQDSMVVADLLRIYLLSLAAMCLASVTSKGFYVTRDTRTLAIFGTLEAGAYVVYTIMLARNLGPMGIALGYVIYLTGSLVWQIVVLKLRLGKETNLFDLKSFGITVLAAGLAGFSSYVVLGLTGNLLAQLAAGLLGLMVYLFFLYVLRSAELKLIVETLFSKTKSAGDNNLSA